MLSTLNQIALLAQDGDEWSDVFLGMGESQRFVLLISIIGCATGIICLIVGCVSGAVTSIHRHRLDAEMKREMLDRGMSAEEIARVVESKQPKDWLDRWAAGQRKRKTG
jgi:hypothetical protein